MIPNPNRCALALVLPLGGSLLCFAAPAASPKEDQKLQDEYVYKTIGDRELKIEMSYPDDWKPTDKRPAIVFFFGGGWTSGTTGQFQPQAQYFAKRGLVCARADYRVKSRDGVLPDKCVEDARSAMRWVRAHAAELGIDPDRIVASGGSAGGHLAACTYFSDKLNDPNDDLSVSPKPDAMILYNPALDFDLFKDSDKDRFTQKVSEETIDQLSPTHHLTKDTPPTLLIDGTADMLKDHTVNFLDKGKELGTPVEAYFAPDQPHGFFNGSPWIEKTTEAADEFLQKIGYLSAEPTVPLPSKERAPKKKSEKQGGKQKAKEAGKARPE